MAHLDQSEDSIWSHDSDLVQWEDRIQWENLIFDLFKAGIHSDFWVLIETMKTKSLYIMYETMENKSLYLMIWGGAEVYPIYTVLFWFLSELSELI